MSIDKITRQHFLEAVAKIERECIDMESFIEFDSKAYSPKEIMRYANLLANGTMNGFTVKGSQQTNI